MKYFTTIILLLIVFSILIFFETTIAFFFNILIIPFFYLTLFYWEYSIFDKIVESDFKIRSYKKSLNNFKLIYGVCWLLFVFLGSNTMKIKILFFILFGAFFVVNLMMSFLYKKRKPFTVFIKNSELIAIVDRWTQKRDIVGLNQIQFDRINKKIKFSFDEGYQISIQTKDYQKEDIDELLRIIIEKSKHPIFIPNNYKAEKLIKES
ncbi:hypothetical protein [Polaribacter sp. SA4-12]|uniref:hypothetical protein n=1 Tax=Polaribacter sp. SA4-12 TaxID=1312072 RepID=UPI000B3CAE83|nr:hypothetical protein [Polaribacter sp. SA4-12]ARV16299.1 hypothetical protein BTO07_14600 [Polaribacter sp. SA4-12]